MIEVPRLMFVPAQPVNLTEVIEAQVRRLMEASLPGEVGVDEAKFLDDAMALAGQFAFSTELAAIRLDQAWFVHYGVSARYLCEAGGVGIYNSSDDFVLCRGVTTPDGLRIVQGQLGQKYKDCMPCYIRGQHDPLERVGVPEEGLTAFLYWGNDLLRESYMDFPGVVTKSGGVPCLHLHDEMPALSTRFDGQARPFFGSVSVSRGS